MSDLAHRALSIVIYEHRGYLQSYTTDQTHARIKCCYAIMADVNRIEQQLSDSIRPNPTPSAYKRGLKRLAKLRKAALTCMRGLVDLPHDDWEDLTCQFCRMNRELPGHLTVYPVAPDDWSHLQYFDDSP